MTKKTQIDHVEVIGWVERLPNHGGAWGQGIIGTIRNLMSEIDHADKQIEELDRQVKQVRGHIGIRRKFVRDTARRAEKEVEALYSDSQIRKAKNEEFAGTVAAAE